MSKKIITQPVTASSYYLFPAIYHVSLNLIVGPHFVGPDERTTERRLQKLSQAGVRTIISLTGRDSSPRQELMLVMEHSLMRYTFAVSSNGVPRLEQVSAILQRMDEALRDRHRVYLHCRSGRGASGLIAGCYLARHNFAIGEAALDFIRHRRRAFGLTEPSPEKEEQRQFVRTWQRGQ